MKILKKAFKFILMIMLLGLVGSLALANVDAIGNLVINITDKLSDAFSTTKPSHKSDNMLLTDGDFYIQLNESSARNHLNSETINLLNTVYDDVIENYKKNNIDVELSSFEIYIQLQSDIGTKMYIVGYYYLDEAGGITRCNYKWYDDKIIFSNISNNYVPGTILRAYKGKTLNVIDTKLYATVSLDNENLYYDTLKDEVITQSFANTIGNVIFTSLFSVGQTTPDDSTTTYFLNVDHTILEQYLNGTMEYNYASDTVYDIYQNNYSYTLDEELDFLQALVCEYSYRNPTTLDILKFYVITNINQEYAGIYYYYRGQYNCLYYHNVKGDILYDNNEVTFDLTNFERYNDHEYGSDVCAFVRECSIDNNGVLQFDSNTDFIYIPEGDLPLEFVGIF